jgi:hypothetical protein
MGLLAVNPRFIRFPATGRLCFELVVALYFRYTFNSNPRSFISLAIRLQLSGFFYGKLCGNVPAARDLRVFEKHLLILSEICRFASLLLLCGDLTMNNIRCGIPAALCIGW